MSASKIAIGFMHVLAKLPLPVLRGLGKFVGRVLFVVAGQRRRIALRNLELCFPDVPEKQRKEWVKESFEVFCQTFIDRSWLWFGSEELVRSRMNWKAICRPSCLRRISTAWTLVVWHCR